ncbi:MAG: hypothetical protein KIH08_12260 [Candidatus Freyarchaeota archaeon]|nr:hypothetical protein [Candidatus Jordarchaeia archaeon]MBS7268302.1 hypothetical protein [Candidatus Jordarchaeia archaeon]
MRIIESNRIALTSLSYINTLLRRNAIANNKANAKSVRPKIIAALPSDPLLAKLLINTLTSLYRSNPLKRLRNRIISKSQNQVTYNTQEATKTATKNTVSGVTIRCVDKMKSSCR